MEQILFEKAKHVLKVLSEDNKETATILIVKCIEHSNVDIMDFIGEEAPYNEIQRDVDAKLAVATNCVSMLMVPLVFSAADQKKPAFDYTKPLANIKKCKSLSLISDKELTNAVVDAKLKEIQLDCKQYVNVAAKGKDELLLSVDNAIKMLQFGTDGWKQELPFRPLIKVKDGKTMVLMPSAKK